MQIFHLFKKLGNWQVITNRVVSFRATIMEDEQIAFVEKQIKGGKICGYFAADLDGQFASLISFVYNDYGF